MSDKTNNSKTCTTVTINGFPYSVKPEVAEFIYALADKRLETLKSLDKMTEKYVELTNELQDYKKEISNNRTDQASLLASVKHEINEKKIAVSEKKIVEEKLQKLREQYNKVNQENVSLKDQVEYLELEIKQDKLNRKNLESELASCKKDRNRYVENDRTLRNKVSSLNNVNRLLNKDKESLKSELTEYKTSNIQLKQWNISQNNEIESLKAQVKFLKKDKDFLNAEISDCKIRLREDSAENHETDKRNIELMNYAKQLEDKLEIWDKAVSISKSLVTCSIVVGAFTYLIVALDKYFKLTN